MNNQIVLVEFPKFAYWSKAKKVVGTTSSSCREAISSTFTRNNSGSAADVPIEVESSSLF